MTYPKTKIVILGSKGVGKTSLIKCICHKQFQNQYKPTSCCVNRTAYKSMEFYECDGKELGEFRIEITGADAVVICYDTANMSLRDIKRYNKMAHDMVPSNRIIICGLKSDITSTASVSSNYIEVSSKNSQIEELLHAINEIISVSKIQKAWENYKIKKYQLQCSHYMNLHSSLEAIKYLPGIGIKYFETEEHFRKMIT